MPATRRLTDVALAAIAAAAGTWARLAFVEEHPPRFYVVSDMQIYEAKARALSAGTWTAADTFTPIGYPAFLALVYRVFGAQPDTVGALQAVIGGATAGLVYFLARRLDPSRWVAFAAGLAVALYPPLVLYAGFLLTETLFAFLLATFALLASSRQGSQPAPPARSIGRRASSTPTLPPFESIAAGIVLSAAILVRPSLFLLVPWIALGALIRHDPAARRTARWILAGAAPLLAAASIVSSALLGRPALSATNGGINAFLAYSECRSVRLARGPILEVSSHMNRARFTERCDVPVDATDERWFYRATAAQIVRDPKRLGRTALALIDGVGLGPVSPEAPAFWPGSTRHAAILDASSRAFAPLVLIPALAHAILRRRRRAARSSARAVLWAAGLSVLLAMALLSGNPRVRVSSDPLFIALAATAWAALIRRVRRGSAN